jgi:hypothetical protein
MPKHSVISFMDPSNSSNISFDTYFFPPIVKLLGVYLEDLFPLYGLLLPHGNSYKNEIDKLLNKFRELK